MARWSASRPNLRSVSFSRWREKVGMRVARQTKLQLLLALTLIPAAHAQCKLALDVGHTLSQPGATSARGVPEFQFNQRLAQSVAAATAQAGIPTITIGATGTPLQLTERTRLAQAAGATLFLSIHHDSVQARYLSTWTVDGRERPYSDQFSGFSLFVSAANPKFPASVAFATAIGSSLRAAGLTPSLHHAEPIPGESRPLLDANLGLYRFDGLAVLRTATMPAVLLEAAIILNRRDEERARSPEFLQRVSAAVVRAVSAACPTTNKPTTGKARADAAQSPAAARPGRPPPPPPNPAAP